MPTQASFSLAHLSRPPLHGGADKAPALLLLHGVGSNEQDLMALAPYLDPRFHLLSARAPIPMGPMMYGWYWIEPLPDGNFHYEPEEALQSLERLVRFLGEIISEYNLDPARLFLGGFSQGAILSCAALLVAPQQIAGVVAMSGRWPEPVPPAQVAASRARLTDKPMLVVHGTQDPVIPIAYGRELQEKFRALPVALTYQEYPMGHTISEESIELVRTWLTNQLDQAGGGASPTPAPE